MGNIGHSKMSILKYLDGSLRNNTLSVYTQNINTTYANKNSKFNDRSNRENKPEGHTRK